MVINTYVKINIKNISDKNLNGENYNLLLKLFDKVELINELDSG